MSEVRSSDGIAVTVDLLLTLGITDPLRLAYTITSSDLDQLVHASTQEAVRTLIRGTEALDALDLDIDEAARLRETIDAKLTPYGIEVRAVAFTRVALPAELMASVEARRLAAVQLIEEEQNFVLEQRRISDRASLLSQEAEARRSSIEHEAAGEAIRLARLEERLAASPRAATLRPRDLAAPGRAAARRQLAGRRLGGRRPAPRGPARGPRGRGRANRRRAGRVRRRRPRRHRRPSPRPKRRHPLPSDASGPGRGRAGAPEPPGGSTSPTTRRPTRSRSRSTTTARAGVVLDGIERRIEARVRGMPAPRADR